VGSAQLLLPAASKQVLKRKNTKETAEIRRNKRRRTLRRFRR